MKHEVRSYHSDSDNVWTMHAKIDQNKFTFPQISHLSSNRRVRNLTFYFQFTTPARELTHRMKFEHVWMQKDMNFGNTMILCYLRPEKMPKTLPRKTRILGTPCFFTTLGQRNAKKQTQKDTNFGNAIFLHYLEPENCQIQLRKIRILHKTALIDPSKNAKESIHISRISHIVLKCTH